MDEFYTVISAEELEGISPELTALKGISFSHMDLAHSLWIDKYGQITDPSVLGFAEKHMADRNLPETFWAKFKSEWYTLICTGDQRYTELRGKMDAIKGAPATVIVSTLAAVIAKSLSVEAALLIPFIAIFLHSLVSTGKNAMCSAFKEDCGNG